MFGGGFGGAPFGTYAMRPLAAPAPKLFALLVDWNGDGNYSHALSNVTGDLKGPVTTDRGRGIPNPLVEYANPGTFSTYLDDSGAASMIAAGKYSSLNSAGPLFGKLNGRIAVQWRSVYGIRWTGYSRGEFLLTRQNNLPVAQVNAQGPLSRIQGTKINPAANAGALTGTIIAAILTAAGWTGGSRLDAGQTTTGPWYVQAKDALQALREIEDTELGFVNEGADGAIVYEDHAHRTTGAALVAQQIYIDYPLLYGQPPYVYVYNDIEEIDTTQDVVNDVPVTVTPYSSANSLAVLWTYAGATIVIPHGGGSVTLIALANNTGLYVSSWTTPVATTDWTCTGAAASDLSASGVSKGAKQMTFTLTNNNVSTDATMTLIQARGVSVPGATAVALEGQDATSETLYGVMTYRRSPAWLPNVATAQPYIAEVLLKGKTLREGFSLSFEANPYTQSALFQDLMTRNISDRVTIVGFTANTAIYMAQDFFIERIQDYWDPQQPETYKVTFDCSAVQAEDEATSWILGDATHGVLGVTSFLGF